MRLHCILAALTVVLSPALATENVGDVVARIGKLELNAASLAPFVRALDPALRKQALSDPDLMERLAGQELARMAVLNEAVRQSWQERADIARKVARAKDDTIFSSYLDWVAKLPKDYPSGTEIAAAYDLNRDVFMTPRQYRLQQIFIALPATGKSEDAAQTAAALANLAKAKIVDFGALARLRSGHKESADKGGDLGFVSEPQLIDEIRAIIPAMEIGEVSDPIFTPSGWHIVRLTDTKPAGSKPLAEVKDELATMLRQKKLQESRQAYVASLLTKSPVAVNREKLKQLFESEK